MIEKHKKITAKTVKSIRLSKEACDFIKKNKINLSLTVQSFLNNEMNKQKK